MCASIFLQSSFVGILLIKLSEQVPIEQSIFKFEDDWDYKIKPHNSPMLNGSFRNFLSPSYSFANDLKVEGLQTDNKTNNSTLHREAKIVGDIIRTKVSCGVCNLGVSLLYKEVKSGTSFEEIKVKFVSICVTLKIESYKVCDGIFETYGREVIPVIEIASLGPAEVCKLMIGETCITAEVISHEWSVDFPDVPKPKVNHNQTPLVSQVGVPIFKVLQISDTHYDFDYAAGSVANCEEPLCCRNYSTLRKGEEIISAGRWGSYEKCDTPKDLLENMLRHIVLQHPDIDYILWTGDLPPHDIWNQTKETNLKTIRNTVEMVREAFPNTPIFPAIGNHESSPAGNFAPPWMTDPEHSILWLYEEIARTWLKWLPASAETTIFHGAFYSILLRPGFRLISVNTNYCHSLSWWLYVNSTDPASELKWLIQELQQAENNGEKVHIIGHIAPGSFDCMKTWSGNFYNIVNRYENTIKALFYGHSHADEFELFYENTEEIGRKNLFRKILRWRKTRNMSDLKLAGRPTAVAYLAPSVTSYTNYNPAYRIYYVEGDHETTTREIIDHETWTFDLDEANYLDNEPRWYKSYSAKDEYRMAGLGPNDWNELLDRMILDDDLFNTFYRNYYRNSPKIPKCDSKCKIRILCDLKSAKSHSRRQLCNELELAIKLK